MLNFLTISIHVDSKAFPIPAGLALVPPGDIDDTPAAIPADIGQVSPHAPLEEASASIAAVHAIVAPGTPVPAHLAGNVQSSLTSHRCSAGVVGLRLSSGGVDDPAGVADASGAQTYER